MMIYVAVFALLLSIAHAQDAVTPTPHPTNPPHWSDALNDIGTRSSLCDSSIFQSGYMKLGLCSPLLGSLINGIFKNSDFKLELGPCSIPCRALGCALQAMGCAEEYLDIAEDWDQCAADSDGLQTGCAEALGDKGKEYCTKVGELLWTSPENKLPLAIESFTEDGLEFLLQQLAICDKHEDTTLGFLLDLINGPLVASGSNSFLTSMVDWLKTNRGPCSNYCRGMACGINLIGCTTAAIPIITHINDHHESEVCEQGDLACGGFVTPAPTPIVNECEGIQCPAVAECRTDDKPWMRLKNGNPQADTPAGRCCPFCEDPCVTATCVDKSPDQCATEGISVVTGKPFTTVRQPSYACCLTCGDPCEGLVCSAQSCEEGQELRLLPDRCCPQCLHPCQGADRICPEGTPQTQDDCPLGSNIVIACQDLDVTGQYKLCSPPNCCNQCQNQDGQVVEPNNGPLFAQTWFIALIAAIVAALLITCCVIILLCFLSRRRKPARKTAPRSRSSTAGRSMRGRSMRSHSHRSNPAGGNRDYDALQSELGGEVSPYADVGLATNPNAGPVYQTASVDYAGTGQFNTVGELQRPAAGTQEVGTF